MAAAHATSRDFQLRLVKMLRVNHRIAIPEDELEETFVRASGPGGQNVNKVATAVQLRFNAASSPLLDEETRRRLRRVAGKRMTAEGEIVITARRFRSQERNREDARERLAELLRQAAERPRRRRPTRPGKAAKERRLREKTHRGAIKRQRGGVRADD